MSNGETLVMDSVNISAKISSSCRSRRQAAAAPRIFPPLLASIYHRVCQNTVFFFLFLYPINASFRAGFEIPHADFQLIVNEIRLRLWLADCQEETGVLALS